MKENIFELANCIDLMKIYEDGYFDIIIADPPYGIDFQSSRTIERVRKKKIKNDKKPYLDWIKEAYRVLSENGCMICFYRWDVQNDFMKEIILQGFKIKSQIVWDKVSHGMGDLKSSFGPQHELMFFCTKGNYKFPGNRPTDIYSVLRKPGKDLIHPNEKPVALISRILNDISTPGQKAFIPFVGSGTDIISCIEKKIIYVGAELDEEYYNSARNRIQRFKNQTVLSF